MSYIHLNSVDSTNDYAKRNIANLAPYSLVIADEQTKGRGRGNHSFYSPKSTGLYMSCVLKENADLKLYTPAAAVAVISALNNTTDFELSIKWVNDIYLKNKKICGILCERIQYNDDSYIIIGIGVNITTSEFPDELSNAGSLNIDIDVISLGETIYNSLLEINTSPNDEQIFENYKKHMNLLGKRISFIYNHIRYTGVLYELNNDCSINVLLDDGNTINLNSGEISIIRQELSYE